MKITILKNLQKNILLRKKTIFLRYLCLGLFSLFAIGVSAQTYWDTNGNTVAAGKNKLGTLNDFEVKFITYNIERMRLTNTGYLGIGTTSPTQVLDVNGQIRLRFSPVNYGVLTTDADGNASWQWLNLEITTDHKLKILNHGNSGVSLDPYLDNTDSQELSLTGTSLSISNGNSVSFTGWDTNASDDFSGNYNDLTNQPTLFDGNWSSLIGTVPAISTFNNDVGYITNAADADADPVNEIQDLQLDGNILTITQNGTATQIDLSQYLDDTDTQLTESEVVNIANNNGFITNPADADADPTNEIQNLSISGDMLGISGGTGVSLDGLNYWTKLNSNLYYNSGSIGIGISEPNKLLHLHSSIYNLNETINDVNSEISFGSLKATPVKPSIREGSEATLLLTNLNSGNTATDGLLIRSYNSNASIYLQEEGSLSLITKNSLRFKMQQNGNVSIGSSSTNYFTVNENGNVGVGTDEPGANLHVKGDRIIVEENQKYIHINASNPNAEIGSSTGEIKFWYTNGIGYNNIFCKDMYSYGNVGIGTDEPQFKLDVRGTAHFLEVRVRTEDWSDFVFEDDYILPDLTELELFIKQNKHLPGIPNEAEVIENGIDLGEMNKNLLQKVEELTLIIIEQNKILQEQGERIRKLEEANQNQ